MIEVGTEWFGAFLWPLLSQERKQDQTPGAKSGSTEGTKQSLGPKGSSSSGAHLGCPYLAN